MLHFMDLLCKSLGNPLNRVFHEQTVHWTVCSPFLIFMQAKKIRFLRKATNFLKKVGSKTFNVAAR